MKQTELKLDKELVMTKSAIKQISLIGKINEPFNLKQICIKKEISTKEKEEFEKNIKEADAKLICIRREYDGTERYWLCYKAKTDESKFTQSKEIIYM